MKLFLYSLCVVTCLSLLLCVKPRVTDARAVSASTGGAASNQKQCRPGKTSTEAAGWRWERATVVHVYYLKGSFSQAERDALGRAVRSWDSALSGTEARVRFVIGGERESLAEENASLTVLRGIPRGKDRVGQIRLYTLSNGVVYAAVTVSPAVTDPAALTSLMAHELGHSLGLADCYGCERGTTAMAAFRSDNKGNDVYEPSECDKYVVAAGYDSAEGQQARASSVERR
ncbi:MAG TPA: hypothetical protein VEV81_10185 [Pyrinomonadaceae bacterium]|nr:hypothetical protein [Pyrinomonadaceae bacterium]